MTTLPIVPGENLRILGRLDPSHRPLALDWTGSGLEVRFRGTDIWAELEAPAASPVFWMIVLADGRPVTRFPVEQGKRFYPLLLGMEADKERTVTLMKETQCMPGSPEATIFMHSLRFEGELLPLPEYKLKIEFVGDSLTSGEGALAPAGNEEWIMPWFSARGNYSWYACNALNAERRILSQSGYGVNWDWDHQPSGNMSFGYEQIVGVLSGPEAEARGCRKNYDFSSWPADIVCVRLLTNDSGAMDRKESFDDDREIVIIGCLELLRKIRRNNPAAKIVWILPDTSHHPELAEEAIRRAEEKGITGVTTFTLPDFGPEDCGARSHPNAEWNRMAGQLLADYLATLI